MLYHSGEIFKGAQYLYSLPDKSGDPNIYRWNYFYTPVQIGDDVVGVRIAVRDMVRGTNLDPESQIYHWGIKEGTSLDGGRRGPKVDSSGVSSDVSSRDSIPQPAQIVNPDTGGGEPAGVGAAARGFPVPGGPSLERRRGADEAVKAGRRFKRQRKTASGTPPRPTPAGKSGWLGCWTGWTEI